MAMILILSFHPFWAHVYGDLHFLPILFLVQNQCKNARKKRRMVFVFFILSTMKTSTWKKSVGPSIAITGADEEMVREGGAFGESWTH